MKKKCPVCVTCSKVTKEGKKVPKKIKKTVSKAIKGIKKSYQSNFII